jgi:hypothetical protein
VKNPSFWVRNTDVVWKYGRVGDAVVPVEVSSTAKVRLFGASSFRMTYDYVTIAGRPVGGRAAESSVTRAGGAGATSARCSSRDSRASVGGGAVMRSSSAARASPPAASG